MDEGLSSRARSILLTMARLTPERLPLLKGLLWSWSLAVVGGASFVGELKHWRWRYGAEAALAAMLVALGFIYWP